MTPFGDPLFSNYSSFITDDSLCKIMIDHLELSLVDNTKVHSPSEMSVRCKIVKVSPEGISFKTVTKV